MLPALDPYRSERLTHYDSTLQPEIMRQFHLCRHSNRFIDLEVEVEGVVFPCHQILLDAFCPYFAAYFSFCERSKGERSVEERECDVKRVSLKYNGVTVNGFSKLLEFMYTAELEVTADDVIDVLRCADFLQFHQVVYLCSTFLQQHISSDTCLQVLVLARAHDLVDLGQKALSFVLTHLAEAMFHPEFTQLSQEMLVEIVGHDCLEVDTEVVVMEAVMIWVKGKERQRVPALPSLLQRARMRSIDFQHLEKAALIKMPDVIGQERTITEVNFSLRSAIEEMYRDDQNRDGNFSQRSELNSPEVSPSTESIHREVVGQDERTDADFFQQSVLDNLSVSPLPDRLTEVLVVVCRETQRKHRGLIRDMSSLFFYDPESLRWEVLTRLPFEDRQDYSAAAVVNLLYLTGGQSTDIHDVYCTKIVFNENWTYDPLLDRWQERQAMMIPRYNHSASSLNGKLYVIGGRASTSNYRLRGDGEAYDPVCNQWTFISPLRCIDGIGNTALAALDGKLYLCGGTCFTSGRRSHIPYENNPGAQIYDPKDDLWQELLALERETTQRHIHMSRGHMVSVEGFLILLDDKVGKSHQLYNPVSQTMTGLMQGHGHHWFAGWAVYKGQLVCTGGLEDGRSGMTDMVHAWDLTAGGGGEGGEGPEVGRWHMLAPLPRPMSHHACLHMHLNLPRPGTQEEEASTPHEAS